MPTPSPLRPPNREDSVVKMKRLVKQVEDDLKDLLKLTSSSIPNDAEVIQLQQNSIKELMKDVAAIQADLGVVWKRYNVKRVKLLKAQPRSAKSTAALQARVEALSKELEKIKSPPAPPQEPDEQ